MSTFNVEFDSTSTVQFTAPKTNIEAARIMTILGLNAFMYTEDYTEIFKTAGQRAGEYDIEEGTVAVIGENGQVLYKMEI